MQGNEPLTPEPVTAPASRRWIAYVLPMVVFMAMTALEGKFPAYYFGLYIAKIVVVTLTLLACKTVWSDIRPDVRVLPLAFFVGLAVFVEWIMIDPLTPHFAFLGKRTGFNPYSVLPDATQRSIFLAFRFTGLTVLVPIMEELFWRSFLLRYISDPDYEKLPLGTFTWGAFAMVAGGFALAHQEWLAAIFCAVAYGLLLKQTKSLFACIVAHAVTNLALGLYILVYGAWHYW